MSLIKPRTRGKQLVRHITRLDRENAEALYAYAAFLNEPAEYVLNQLIDTVLAKDREFVAAGRPSRVAPPGAAPAHVVAAAAAAGAEPEARVHATGPLGARQPTGGEL